MSPAEPSHLEPPTPTSTPPTPLPTPLPPPPPLPDLPPLPHLPADASLAALPPVWPHDQRDHIDALLAADDRVLVVLDDDPTGTQTVHGVAVLTTWAVDDLAAELVRARCLFVMTNSRSLDEAAAVALATEVGTNLRLAGERTGRSVAVISRSDSTLRGHFPAEVDALIAALEPQRLDAVVIAPWFLDGGRVTLDGVHYARIGDELVPAAQTEFARDASFGYRNSRLADWVQEKTGGRIAAESVVHVGLEALRAEGPAAVLAALATVPRGGYVSFDAAHERDVEVVVAGLLQAEAAGHRHLYRTAASFVRVRAGIRPKPFLPVGQLGVGAASGPSSGPSSSPPSVPSSTPSSSASSGRLVVVGSHVARSSEQLAALLALPHIVPVELDVDRARRDPAAECGRCREAVDAALAQGRDVVLYTSRTVRTGADAAESLAISAAVSTAVVEVVRTLQVAPRLLVAKGGITSSDVATRALGVRRAEVLGQVQAGVPVWELGPESRFPGMRYVVFPGNVGSADSLVELLRGDPAGAGS